MSDRYIVLTIHDGEGAQISDELRQEYVYPDECVDMLNSHEFEAAKLQSKLDAATEESRLLIAARNEKGEQLGELRREIEQLKRERDQRDLEQQAKALDDFANLTLFPSMGHGFSDGYCAGFEAALSAAARNAEQLRQQAKGE